MSAIAVNELTYHRHVFAVLNRTPIRSASAVETIEACELRVGLLLPGSLREWYTLENTASILQHAAKQSRAMPLDQLLTFWESYGPKMRLSSWYFSSLDHEHADIHLDGQDDPPLATYCRYPSDPAATGAARRHASVSEFILETVWNDLFWPPRIFIWTPRDHGIERGQFGPAHLDYLLEQYSALSRIGPLPARDLNTGQKRLVHAFRFFHPGLRIQIDCHGDATTDDHLAHWAVSADTVTHAEQFLDALFRIFGHMPFCVVQLFAQAQKQEMDTALQKLAAKYAPARRSVK